jgi:hypothetical protein
MRIPGTGSPRGRRYAARATVAVVALLVPFALAFHWQHLGWRDVHYNYPSRPSGYTQIVNRFGQPCSAYARAISMSWVAADTGQTYSIAFHRKLGGYPTAMVGNRGGSSTNLDNDVYGHIQNAHLQPYVQHGIWGYNCRTIRGSSQWSTHAWGIAIDVSSAAEPMGQTYSAVNYRHSSIWQAHNWYWGLAFNDPMHFQYATGY